MRTAKELYKSAYSEGYVDGEKAAKESYGQSKGIAHCHKATLDEMDEWGLELWGWCDCGKPILGLWVGHANFCPWCGKIIEWERGDENGSKTDFI